MIATGKQHEWNKYLSFFCEQNLGRQTRLGVFEEKNGVVTDYWLESGLPLVAIDLDMGEGLAAIQITVGSYTHVVKDAAKLDFQFSFKGDEDGIDIHGADHKTTILRFENLSLET